MVNKMNGCIANAARHFSSRAADELTTMCKNLEDVEDVRRITKILADPQA
jgi:hypothetical protein